MVEISLSGFGEGPGLARAPAYATAVDGVLGRDRRLSRRAAINAKCRRCMGPDPGVATRIRECTITTCPLYPVRPYQILRCVPNGTSRADALHVRWHSGQRDRGHRLTRVSREVGRALSLGALASRVPGGRRCGRRAQRS
jgi:hypothetical protein